MGGSQDGQPHDDRRDDGHRSRHSNHHSRSHRQARSRSPERRHRRRSEDQQGGRKSRTQGEGSSRRDRSPHRHRHRHHSHKSAQPATNVTLPFEARQLVKRDLDKFEPLLSHYLFVQKQKDSYEMDEREIKGRWKSFMSKWNRNELAEGWYDPEMFARIVAMQPDPPPRREDERCGEDEKDHRMSESDEPQRDAAGGSDDEEDYGPTLPGQKPGRRMGAGIPSKDDLAERDSMRLDDREAAREELRTERKADRKLQKERLDELVPRAEAGTRERKLEKKHEANEKMRAFRDKSPDDGAANDGELMGGGDSLAEFKQAKQQEQRRKTEREIRREEFERAKREEMEERRRQWQEREKGTVSMLQELARQRFG